MKALVLFLLFLSASNAAFAQDPASTYTTEEAKEDYRAFLKKLKELNAQYKHMTGEMAQVMKEEGVPTWDMGNLDQQIDEIFPQKTSSEGVDIKENNKEVVVHIDLPGIQRKSLKTTVQEGNKLNIKAERTIEDGVKKIKRVVVLPAPVDPRSAKAKYQDGVLTIRLTKAAPQEIPINIQ